MILRKVRNQPRTTREELVNDLKRAGTTVSKDNDMDLGCTDCPNHVVYGNMKEKDVDYGRQVESQFPDLSVFLSQEELNKSVDLACKSFEQEGQEQVDESDVCPHNNMSYIASTMKPSHEKTEIMPEKQVLQSPIQENKLRNFKTPRQPDPDYKKPIRSTPYGQEIQSKKEFLNKAADFIEELSSLFKANSSKRIRPRACKAHRSQSQNKHFDAASFVLDSDNRERPVHNNEPLQFPSHINKVTKEPNNTEMEEQEPICEIKPDTSEPVYEPPHFIQKLRSREVPEGSKVQLDCIVRGFPAPDVRWFCEGKELENSPDIQVINNGELHSLIITEAFEEDTGRYSCFASNFCGTDSTSAEIYIEGATSSDSDGEQYFEAQMHKRASQLNATMLSEAPTASLNDEDSLTSLCLNQSAPPENVSTLTNHLASSTIAAEGDTPSAQVNCSKMSAENPPPVPASQLIPSAPSDQSVNTSPTPTLSQEASYYMSIAQQNFTESENKNGYPQGLDGRPIMAAPVFTKNLQDLQAFEGQLVVLECRVKGVPSPKADWYREGMLIEDSPDFRILQKSNGDNSNKNKTLAAEPCHQEPGLLTITSKYPLASCLKTKSKKVLESHSEPRSSCRVGRTVTFKLPEDDEKSKSNEDVLSSTSPPPVLAKPKLPQAPLKSNHRSPWPRSDEETDIHDSKVNLLHEFGKKLQFKNELPHYGQQKLTCVGKVSRPIGSNTPTATFINYDEEYKVSNFEQRLMSEIEFRLERTPVEESDDEIQHEEIPTGKCIAPLFDKKLKNFRAIEGVPVTFTCKVVGIPIPKVYWFKDGKQILKKNRHFRRIREGDGTCSLYIEAATNDDDGNYTVMAANPQGRISCSGHLIVQSGLMRNRPMIHSQRSKPLLTMMHKTDARKQFAEDKQTKEGQYVLDWPSMSSDLKPIGHLWGILKLKVEERKVSNIYQLHAVVMGEWKRIPVATCKAVVSSMPKVRSRIKQVEEGEPCEENFFRPHFLQAPGDMVSHEGRLCRLDCKVSGLPHPEMFWLLNGKPICPDLTHRMLVRENGIHSLVIDPLAKDDAGTYTCIASNKAGQSSFCLKLSVVEKEIKQAPQFVEKLQNTGIAEGTPVRLGMRVVGMPPTFDLLEEDNDTITNSMEKIRQVY
ncbi:hypothetical protein NFI96_016678 [Prochilodus magdalenae]|nr:hypothetical protein NFI96_016678 [Prochilodus magdalenae]